MKEDLSRRDFLKLATVGVVAICCASKLGTSVGEAIANDSESKPVVIKEPELSPEQTKLVDEIIEFRKSLGLEGTPLEMGEILLENNDWTREVPIFENDLPNKNTSYGDYTKEVILKLFGTHATRLIKGSRFESTLPYEMRFSDNERFCLFPDDVHKYSIDGIYIDFILHEAGGHGTDPKYETAKYPKDVFIKVEHGKWHALTQMFDLPGEMLNNPGDMMYPMLKKQIGKTVGKTFTANGNLEQILDTEGGKIVEQEISTIAASQGKDIKDLKFNKAVCKKIASSIISFVLADKVKMKGKLKETYADILENNVAVEIYAEMVKYAILFPEKMNTTVIQGVNEVIDAINGKPVDLNEMKKSIKHPSWKIIDRNLAEAEAIGSMQKEQIVTAVPVLTEEELKKIAEQQSKIEKDQLIFNNFINYGKLPETLHFTVTQSEQIKKYADLYSAYNNKYPGIINVNFNFDDGFDPDMNIWDIEELGYSLDSAFIRGLLQTNTVSDQIMGEIVKKTQILEKLGNIPLFP